MPIIQILPILIIILIIIKLIVKSPHQSQYFTGASQSRPSPNQTLQILRDSIETAITLQFFKDKQESSYNHIYNSHPAQISLKKFQNEVNNFNPNRLKHTPALAYPPNDRPRGEKDITSVEYYTKQKHSC